jgi:hypothetical protein
MGVQQRHDMEITEEYMCNEIPVSDIFSLVIVKRYFTFDCNVKLEKIMNCFRTKFKCILVSSNYVRRFKYT